MVRASDAQNPGNRATRRNSGRLTLRHRLLHQQVEHGFRRLHKIRGPFVDESRERLNQVRPVDKTLACDLVFQVLRHGGGRHQQPHGVVLSAQSFTEAVENESGFSRSGGSSDEPHPLSISWRRESETQHRPPGLCQVFSSAEKAKPDTGKDARQGCLCYADSGFTQKLSRHTPPGGTLCNSVYAPLCARLKALVMAAMGSKQMKSRPSGA